MADTATPTAGIELIIVEDQSPGWGTKASANMTKIDLMLGTTLAADANPNGSVAGYQNQIITDANVLPLFPIAWICTLQGDAANAEWARIGRVVKPQLTEQRDVWSKAQPGVWRVEASPDISLTQDDAFVSFVMGADTNIELPTGADFTVTDAQMIVIYIAQGVTRYNLTSDAGITWPGGLGPTSPFANNVGLYTLVKIPGTGLWKGSYALY